MRSGAPSWLAGDDWTRLRERARRATFAPGTPVVVEGQRQGDLFVVVAGYARVERQGNDRGIAIARLGPGEAFGEMSLLEDAPASASVVAEEGLVADVIAGVELRAMLEADPAFAARFYRSLAVSLSGRLRSTTAQLAELGATDVSVAPRRRSVLTGHVTERQIPAALSDAVADFHTSMWKVEERLLRGVNGDPQPAVEAACDGLLGALERCLREEVLVEAGYDDLLAFRDPAWLATGFGAYLFRQAFPLLMSSTTLARCHAKPSGYAGDPETIDRIYADAPDGDGVLGRFVDRWFLSRPYCVARREARRKVADQIAEARGAAGRAGTPLPVLSLTCRAPRELLDALGEGGGAQLRVTCLDGDQAALRHGARLAERARAAQAFSMIHANVAKLAEGHGSVALAPQALIYGLGLSDGQDDEALVRVLDWAHERLEPRGMLLLGGTVPDHPDFLLMEHVLEWHANARTAGQLEALAARSRFAGGSVTIETDPGGVMVWMRLTADG